MCALSNTKPWYVGVDKAQTLEAGCLGSNSTSVFYLLCDLEQITQPLCAYGNSNVEVGHTL